jgi:hypothetical protein
MTLTSRTFEVPGDAFDLSFRKPPLGDRNHMPILMGIGDDTVGPYIGLFFDAPSTPEEWEAGVDLTPAHSHVCDNFRIVMKGELWVGPERYYHGEFRLQRASRPYGADGDAPHEEGNWRIISFADRRGARVRPTNPELRAEVEDDEVIAKQREMYGVDILPANDPGVNGLMTTIDKEWSAVQHIDASFAEVDTWLPVANGSTMSVSLLGVHDVGPMWILQRTPAGAVATPAMTVGSDVFRCVIDGSHERSGENVEMGDCRFQSANVAWDEVVAGADGLDEVICIGDRTGLPIHVGDGDKVGWADQIQATFERLAVGLPDLKPAPVRS